MQELIEAIKSDLGDSRSRLPEDEHNRHEMETDLLILSHAKDLMSAWTKINIRIESFGKSAVSIGGKRYPALDRRVFDAGSPISHYQFADVVSDAVPENHLIVTGSSGLAVEVLYTVFRNQGGQRMFLTSG